MFFLLQILLEVKVKQISVLYTNVCLKIKIWGCHFVPTITDFFVHAVELNRQTSVATKWYCVYKIPCHPSGKDPSGHVSKGSVCVCPRMWKMGKKVQDEMGPA